MHHTFANVKIMFHDKTRFLLVLLKAPLFLKECPSVVELGEDEFRELLVFGSHLLVWVHREGSFPEHLLDVRMRHQLVHPALVPARPLPHDGVERAEQRAQVPLLSVRPLKDGRCHRVHLLHVLGLPHLADCPNWKNLRAFQTKKKKKKKVLYVWVNKN
jgi:hypothetical protein